MYFWKLSLLLICLCCCLSVKAVTWYDNRLCKNYIATEKMNQRDNYVYYCAGKDAYSCLCIKNAIGLTGCVHAFDAEEDTHVYLKKLVEADVRICSGKKGNVDKCKKQSIDLKYKCDCSYKLGPRRKWNEVCI